MTNPGLRLTGPAAALSRPQGHQARTLRLVDERHHAPAEAAARRSGPAWARSHRHRLRVSDSVIVAAVVTVAFVVGLPGAVITTEAGSARYWLVAGLVTALWIVMLSAFRTRESRVLSVGIIEYKRVVSACTTTFGLLAIAFVVAGAELVRWYVVVAFPLGLGTLVLSRWIWRIWLVRQGRHGHALSQVVVVGQRHDVEYVVRQIERKSGAAYTVVGTVLDGDGAEAAPSGTLAGLPTSRDLEHVADMAATLGADAVVVAGPPSTRSDFIRNLAWDLEGSATELILATGLANVAGPRIHLRPVEGMPLIHVEIPQFEGGKHLLKRAFDVVVAAVSIIVLSPVLAAIALAIRLDSDGPALFSQERVGRDGRRFTIWKFRTMVTTASSELVGLLDRNEASGVLFKLKNDPRVTRIGRVLRRHSLDELPQLWNILVGDMSLVGPRPPLPCEVDGYENHVRRRLYIRPGLTGMWQINGRSNLSWEESVQLDLYYVENWSLVGDIVIMWRTLRQVTRPVGAY